MRNFLLDSVSGTVGGVLGVLIGSPLDVIKTRLQNGAVLQQQSGGGGGVGRALRAVYGAEGLRSLFKGSLTSALGQAPQNFVIFGTWGLGKRVLGNHNVAGLADPRAKEELDVFLAGSCAGLTQAVFIAPFEHVKVQQQLHMTGSLSMSACASRLIASKGLVRGLGRGTLATLWRDAPTFGLYFVSFERIKAALVSDAGAAAAGGPVEALPVMIAGGAAGVISWFFALPADVIKSVIQGSPIDTPAADLRLLAVARRLYAEAGWRVFFRGLAPCLLRAVPVNAVTFLGYEWVHKVLLSITQPTVVFRQPPGAAERKPL